MYDVMALSLQALQGDAARLERVSANLANAMTPGYKRELLAQRTGTASSGISFASLVESQTVLDPSGPLGADGLQSLRAMQTGTLKNTGQPLDLALTGPGFFEVSTASGPAYTRHGQFTLDARGRVVTAQGHALMGNGGEIVLTGTPSIDGAGAVSDNGRVVGKLRIVAFDDSTQLSRAAGGLYTASASPRPADEREVQVRQGSLENANVDPMREMVDLIGTMRHFESMQRVTQSYDEMLGTAIRRLGEG